MNQGASFIQELILEAEEAEQNTTLAFYDLLIIRISEIQKTMDVNYNNCQQEIDLIQNFMLTKNSKLQGQVDGIMSQLESLIKDRNEKDKSVKSIDLPHGLIRLHKTPNKVEVSDLDKFMSVATSDMITAVSEQLKPNLNGIKKYVKLSGRIPEGISIIEGTEKFSIKIKEV